MRKVYLMIFLSVASYFAAAQDYILTAIGSSTTAGQGAWPQDSSWLSRFSYFYKNEKGVLDSAYRLAVGGYNCYKGMPSSSTPPLGRDGSDPNVNITKANNLLSGLSDPSHGVVIVNYPSNGYDIYSIAEIMTCLQTIYDSAVAAGHKCFITTTQPRVGGNFSTSAIKKKMADIKDSTILRFGVENTLNFYDGLVNPADSSILPQYADNDGIHFNNAGHRVLFERVVAKNVFNIALPVTIRDFTAVAKGSSVMLQWFGEYDHAGTYFIVERSMDGFKFEPVKQIDAHGAGKYYSFTDNEPGGGTFYYRLAVIEPGKKFYSKVVSASIHHQDWFIKSLYPVPAAASQHMTLEMFTEIATPVTLELWNSSGVRLYVKQLKLGKGDHTLQIPVGNLPAGSYFISMQSPALKGLLQAFTR